MKCAGRIDIFFVIRYGGKQLVVLAVGVTPEHPVAVAKECCERVRELNMVHEVSPAGVASVRMGPTRHVAVEKTSPSEAGQPTARFLHFGTGTIDSATGGGMRRGVYVVRHNNPDARKYEVRRTTVLPR